MSAETYTLEVCRDGGWKKQPGYERLAPADANFFSGIANRASSYLARLVRDSDGKVYCGRVPE